MNIRTNTDHPAAFKAAVALAAYQGKQQHIELAERFGVAEEQVRQWEKELLEGAADVFSKAGSRHTTQNGIIEGEELARTIAENSTHGLAMMDERGHCIYANRAWLEMTGFTAEEISSGPLHNLVHHHRPDGRPYPIEECPIDRALPENFEVRSHEDLFFRKDGSTFSVACAASPIFKAGRPVATVIEIRDITERKRMDAELLESQHRAVVAARQAESERSYLNALLEAAPVGIGMADSTGRLIVMNRANKVLWGDNHPLPITMEEYARFKAWWADGSARHGEPLEPHDWALARALRGEEVTCDIVEIAPFDAPHTRKIITLSAAQIKNAEGDVIGAVVAQNDITDRVRAEEALRESDRNKDEFIAVLAHELRNPLAPIRTALDIFAQIGLGDSRLNRAKDAMSRQVFQMTRLVDDLLDVARISRGKVELHKERCDIVHIVRQTLEDFRQNIESNAVNLYLNAPAAPLWVEGDSTRFTQIIGNLLHNASKFTKADDKVNISVQQESTGIDNVALITVQDTGAGMPAELLPKLFNPFMQATQGLGRSSGGLGLGLALVKGLVELHGGTVEAYSEGVGLGSTFKVRLPVSSQKPNPRENTQKTVLENSLAIVVIDDNRDILATIEILLAINGHKVTLAADGADGMDAIRKVSPDAVFCDIGLPGTMNGYDVVEAVRADPQLKGTFMVAMSGYGQQNDRLRSKTMGFDLHLVKPVMLKDLESVLTEAERRRN